MSLCSQLCVNVARQVFQYVLVIPGNHEYYGASRRRVDSKIDEICAACPTRNLINLNCRSFDLEGYRFLGCTLWSFVPPENEAAVMRSLNDYRLIKDDETGQLITTATTNRWHFEQKGWLAHEIAGIREEMTKCQSTCDKGVVVLTHHAPSTRGTSAPRFEGSACNCAFSTDLHSLMGPPVKVWAFGHTHFSSDQMINGTRVVSNQLGYCRMQEPAGFQPNFVLHVE